MYYISCLSKNRDISASLHWPSETAFCRAASVTKGQYADDRTWLLILLITRHYCPTMQYKKKQNKCSSTSNKLWIVEWYQFEEEHVAFILMQMCLDWTVWTNLEGYLQLGCSLGVPGGLVGGSLDVHRHGEDWSVYWARLRQQAVLKTRVDLIQTHQSIHGVVWIRHSPVQD